MFKINWFSTQPDRFGTSGDRKVPTLDSATRLVADLRDSPDVIHVQIKGPGVDQGWVRDGSGAWTEQYNYEQV